MSDIAEELNHLATMAMPGWAVNAAQNGASELARLRSIITEHWATIAHLTDVTLCIPEMEAELARLRCVNAGLVEALKIARQWIPVDAVDAALRSATTGSALADTETNERKEDRICECFGDSGLCASTHDPGTGRRHCDMCGWPIKQSVVDVLTAVNRSATETKGEP